MNVRCVSRSSQPRAVMETQEHVFFFLFATG
jgi:hypothetical protein